MAKSKTRLVADFMGKVQADATTGEAKHQEVEAVTTAITGTLYNSSEIDTMFDDVITEMEQLATSTGV